MMDYRAWRTFKTSGVVGLACGLKKVVKVTLIAELGIQRMFKVQVSLLQCVSES